MGLSPAGGRGGGGGTAGGGDLRLPPPEHSRTVYYDQAHYGPVSGGGAEAGVKGGQAVVGAGRTGFGGDADGDSGGGTDGGGGGDGWDEDGLNRWEDNVAYVTLGTEPNAPLAYALEMELHHPTISKLGEPGGRLERERERASDCVVPCLANTATSTYFYLPGLRALQIPDAVIASELGWGGRNGAAARVPFRRWGGRRDDGTGLEAQGRPA